MKKEIIIKYIKKLDEVEVKEFLDSNYIKLNDEEFEFLFTLIKDKYNDIFDENIYLFKLIRDTINEDAYNKLIKLFNQYKKFLK